MFLVRLSITFKNYLITKGSNFEHLHTKQTFIRSNATIGALEICLKLMIIGKSA